MNKAPDDANGMPVEGGGKSGFIITTRVGLMDSRGQVLRGVAVHMIIRMTIAGQ